MGNIIKGIGAKLNKLKE